MKCVEFQNEFEEQNALSEAAKLHLEDCRNCRQSSSEQDRVWEMLGGLGQVTAPKDFNFRVKARIAEAKSAGGPEREPGFFPAFRYVMPLGFVIILLSFVALSGLYFVETQSVPDVSSGQSPTPADKNLVLPNDDPSKDEVAEIEESTDRAEPNENPADPVGKEFEKPDSDTVADNETKGGGSRDSVEKPPAVIEPPDNIGSRDSAGTDSPTIIQPEFDTKNKPNTRVNPNSSKSVDVKEVLELSGIGTVSEKGRLKVRSIRKNSLAERSGIRVGDVIEAINGKKITGEPLRGKIINVETLTVLRKGGRKEITLKPN